MKALTRRIAVLMGVAALALGGGGVAQAKHGADDAVPHAHHGADDSARTKSCLKRARRSHDRTERSRKVRRCQRAADDRGGHGADDPAGHH
jgi:hypothetical protein